jgi:ribulose-5-phosphate 4-epimerase/fuculose-1-phosphate aldolase
MKNFALVGQRETKFMQWLAAGLERVFSENGYQHCEEPVDEIRLVFNFINQEKPRPFRRKAQATFVVSILETDTTIHDHILKDGYPYLVRSLSNHLVYIVHANNKVNLHFITPEQGYYHIQFNGNDEAAFFSKVFNRLEPLASSQLVINNEFLEDLPEPLWQGDGLTQMMSLSGKKLDEMNLLPAPFPLEEFVTDRDMRQLKKLYGIGGLSYGNLSCRRDETSFWMSASGVDKSNMRNIGQDMLLIKGYNSEKKAMMISVPPHVTPKRASVDAIEHWMIYTEHPEIGAIVHVHAWMDGIKATEINYPCGTIELAETVADLVRQEPNPSKAVIGLKNHGLTITGTSLEDIFNRIQDRILPQVPMV